VDVIDQKLVFADTVELSLRRAASRARIEQERQQPMIHAEISKVADPRRKRNGGWHNK